MLEFFKIVLNFIRQDFIHLETIGLDVSFSVWDLALFLLFVELITYFVAEVIRKGGEK